MFYTTHLQSPIAKDLVVSFFGINPDTQPEAARAAGIYPLTQAPEGYSVSHYEKRGDRYVAIAQIHQHRRTCFGCSTENSRCRQAA